MIQVQTHGIRMLVATYVDAAHCNAVMQFTAPTSTDPCSGDFWVEVASAAGEDLYLGAAKENGQSLMPWQRPGTSDRCDASAILRCRRD